MKKMLLLIGAGLVGLSAECQLPDQYDFSTNPSPTWDFVASAGTGFTWSGSPNFRMNYDVTTQTGTNFAHVDISEPLDEQFVVTFKIHPTAATNGFFPMMLTALEPGTPNNHPWRLNPSPGLGAIQNFDMTGLLMSSQQLQFVERQGNIATFTSFSPSFSLTLNADYWIRFERVCPTTIYVAVYDDAAMADGDLLEDEFFTISPLDPLTDYYSANTNGNGTTTNHQGWIDDVAISVPNHTCCAPRTIDGASLICGTGGDNTFTAGVSGEFIFSPDWSISPSGPVFTESTTSGYSMTVTDWGQMGEYTITFTWVCNCETRTLTKVVNVTDCAMRARKDTGELPGDKAPIVYPNPAAKNLNIQLPEKHGVSRIHISDASGRIVQTQTVPAEQVVATFLIGDLLPGMYTVQYEGTTVYASEQFMKR